MKRHLTEKQLIQYEFGLLDDNRAAKLAEHLDGCDTCRGRLESLKNRFAALDLLAGDVQVSKELLQRASEQTARPHPAARIVTYKWSAWAGAAAAVLVVASLALVAELHRLKRLGGATVGRVAKPAQELVAPLQKPPEPATATRTLGPKAATVQAGSKVRRAAKGGGPAQKAISEEAPFAPASAIELVVLPRRENVQLTIYNSTFADAPSVPVAVRASQQRYGSRRRDGDVLSTGVSVDTIQQGTGPPAGTSRRQVIRSRPPRGSGLTLVRERRNLTLKRGWNWLQFAWANTLIDPTSLELEPLQQTDKIDVQQLVFPSRLRELGRWLIRSEVSGQVPFEITYFTTGVTWRAFYFGTLATDEKTMRLKAYVRVNNRSGEDYENAQTRLIVGRVHLLDQIAALARRKYPYGRPGEIIRPSSTKYLANAAYEPVHARMGYAGGGIFGDELESLRPKEIKKEGLSEYFLYTIEGTETIPTGWSKRLLSFDKSDVPVINLYKYEQKRYGNNVVRFLSFKNDTEHKLGETPIPGGMLKVFRTVDTAGHLAYVGQSAFKYIPVDEDVELNLGPVRDIVVEPTLIDYKTENYEFDKDRNVTGWDELRTFRIEVRNTRDLTVKVEIKRNFKTQYWDIRQSVQVGEFEKVDKDTVKFTLVLEPHSRKQFSYTVRTYHGTRQQKVIRESSLK